MQVWNTFYGNPSFVGPRVLLLQEIELSGNGELFSLELILGYGTRHLVRLDLTSVAQTYAPSDDIPRRHTFQYDALYIRRQSFWLDLRLIALSCWITFRGKWEYRGKKF